MAYDEGLAQRIRECLEEERGVASDAGLLEWVGRGVAFASSLPWKTNGKRARG